MPVAAVARQPEPFTPDHHGRMPRLPDAIPMIGYTSLDDKPVVTVSLSGKWGRGRKMTLDRADWERVSAIHGRYWRIKFNNGVGYVTQAGDGGRSGVMLARIVMKAGPGDRVRYVRRGRQGTRGVVNLDLRRGNLRLLRAGSR